MFPRNYILYFYNQADQEVTEEQIKELQSDKTKLDATISTLQADLQSRTNEMNREIRRKGNANLILF